jgi:hypothetical protein
MNAQNFEGSGIFRLEAGTSRRFAVVGDRRQFVIANLEDFGSGDYLEVKGVGGNTGLIVFPLTSITLRTNGEFTLYNPQGSKIDVCVGTLFGDEYAGAVQIIGTPKA